MMDPAILQLYLVADPDHFDGDLATAVSDAISGGVTCVQLRAKTLTDLEFLCLARRLRDVCQAAEVPLIVNDRLDIALAVNADGIHVGVDDLPAPVIRSLARPDFIVGYSPETDEQIRASKDDGVDYLGVGPVYGSRTKLDAGEALGIVEFRRRCELSPVPVIGIGGITAENAGAVIESGARGVAVVSAILGQEDVTEAARSILRQSGI